MARIDRLIEENLHMPVGLQDICDRTALATRTVGAIVGAEIGNGWLGIVDIGVQPEPEFIYQRIPKGAALRDACLRRLPSSGFWPATLLGAFRI